MDVQPLDIVRLDIGGGPQSRLPGYLSIDRKAGLEAGKLDYPDASVDEVYASHVLEHFAFREVANVLREWVRVLKPAGRLRVAVPDFTLIAAGYLKGERAPHANFLMGGQVDADDFHRSLFDADALGQLLKDAGLERIGRWRSTVDDCAALPISLNLCGYKPGSGAVVAPDPVPAQASAFQVSRHRPDPLPAPHEVPPLAFIMSMPRLTFSDNLFCCLNTVAQLRAEYTKVTGVYWEQCIERGLLMHLDNPKAHAELLFTVDYDTAFRIEEVLRLVGLMNKYPQADAIAPLQLKRDEDAGMWHLCDEAGVSKEGATLEAFEPDVVPALTAHFGLTVFRASALKRMPHPWFHSEPNAQGMWDEGRVDADMSFWRRFRDAGNKLYLAPHVAIGHLQLMVTWPSQVLSPIHQYVNDWAMLGPPAAARR